MFSTDLALKAYVQAKYPEQADRILLADGFSTAFTGFMHKDTHVVLIYSKTRMLESLVLQGDTEGDAIEHLEFNVWNAYVGPYTPYYLDDLEV